MKIFKRVYYPILAVLLVALIVLGFVNATVGNNKNTLGADFVSSVRSHLDEISNASHNSIYGDKQERVANYITSQLAASGVKLGTSRIEDEDTIYDAATDGSKIAPTYVVQIDTINDETLALIDEFRDDDTALWEVDRNISNIVVYLPGTASSSSSDVVMMMAHYDTRIESKGAANNGAQVASMLENIIRIVKDGTTFENDLLFVFTDAKEEGMLGAFTFKNQFMGFNDVFSRVKLGVNFDALGNKGTLAMIDSSSNNYNLISSYGKINGNTFTSSLASMIFSGATTYSDFNIFGDIPSLSFANVGGGDVLNTAHDTIDNLPDSTIIQHANMMNSVIKTFGNFDLASLESESEAVYFSFLDVFTIVYPFAVSYIFGAIMIALMLGIVILNRRNKAFSLTRTGSGAVVQLLSIVSTIVILFALYFLFSLLTSAMGIIPVRAIGRLTQQSVGLVISFMLLSIVFSSFLSIVFRKLFNVNSTDIVRGNVLVWSVIAIILAFAAPKVGYFFVITAMLELVILLLVTVLSNKFKAKFDMPIGKLFPYTLPLIVAFPMIIPIIMLLSMSLTSMFIPLLMIFFVLMTGFFTPYCVLLTPLMEKVFAALPKASTRVEKEVTERIEDKAKKGKFVEKTSIVIVKEKYSIKYRHAYSAIFFALIFSIMTVVFSAVGFTAGKNYTGFGTYRNAVFNSSMVLVWQNVDGSESTFLKVDDLNAYRYIGEAVGGFSWSFGEDAYVKTIRNANTVIGSNPDIKVDENNVYTFNSFSPERSLVTVKLTDASKITKLTLTANDGEEFEFENTESLNTILINIPYKFGNFTLEIEGNDHINVEYTESIMDIGSGVANLAELEDWKDVMSFYSDDESIANSISSGIVFRIVKNRF